MKRTPNPKFTEEQALMHLGDSSRALANLTANMVYDEPGLIRLLIRISLHGDKVHSQRASRIVSLCCTSFPELLQPHTGKIIRGMKTLQHEGAIRNLLKTFAETPVFLNEKEKAILMDLCFAYLTSARTAVSIKVFSMQVLYNMSRELPAIGQELHLILEEQFPDGSAGFKSRASKILRKLEARKGKS
jgi:hypothetical protein